MTIEKVLYSQIYDAETDGAAAANLINDSKRAINEIIDTVEVIEGITDPATLVGSIIAVRKHFKHLSVTHPDPAILVSVTGTGDNDLNPADGGFVEVQSNYSLISEYGDTFTILGNGRVKVNKPCQLDVGGYLDLTHSANNATVAVTFAIVRDGVTTLSPRSIHAKMPSQGDPGNISGRGFLDTLANDEIYLVMASDVTGNVSIRASSLFFETNVLEVL